MWTTNGEASAYENPTLAEIKNYLSVDGSSYDTLLSTIKYGVIAKLESITGQNLNDASALTVTARFTNERVWELPLLPVTSVTSVTSFEEDDSSTALTSGTHYKAYGQLNSRRGAYTLDFFNLYEDVRVIYISNGSVMPEEFKLAVLGWIKTIWNDERDFTGGDKVRPPTMPKETMNLISPYLKVHV